jgi:biopolymer transport protein ExbD
MSWRRRRGGEGRADPNLTPLLDVVLQLITFFMVLVYFGSSLEVARRDVRLPVVQAATRREDLGLDRLPVAIDAEGRLLEGQRGRALSAEEARAWWVAKAREIRASSRSRRAGEAEASLSTVVVVQADGDARYGDVRRALRMAQEAGFARYSLIVERGGAP